MNDVIFFNKDKDLALICRSCMSGEFLDVYNPKTNKITYTYDDD